MPFHVNVPSRTADSPLPCYFETVINLLIGTVRNRYGQVQTFGPYEDVVAVKIVKSHLCSPAGLTQRQGELGEKVLDVVGEVDGERHIPVHRVAMHNFLPAAQAD